MGLGPCACSVARLSRYRLYRKNTTSRNTITAAMLNGEKSALAPASLRAVSMRTWRGTSTTGGTGGRSISYQKKMFFPRQKGALGQTFNSKSFRPVRRSVDELPPSVEGLKWSQSTNFSQLPRRVKLKTNLVNNSSGQSTGVDSVQMTGRWLNTTVNCTRMDPVS